ncbi:MAG: GntR family transcriptional regulator, partial [Anaerolineae bacterium]|nr:GntR family transcriptional regulator [Anaerolineae bacterium]
RPGDELPPVRDMATQWHCAPGTVQRAYHELARQGLITSRPGQGTRVAETAEPEQSSALRRATLINETEAFLLRVLANGYTADDVERALRQALDRWRAQVQTVEAAPESVLRFVGSHDPSLAQIAAQFPAITPDHTLDVTFAGSLGGLIALADGSADIAGCHLWDADTDAYNVAFVRRVLPGRRVALLTLFHRRLGLIVAPGNPLGITGLADLARDDMRLINRQSGAGTRVWLDAQLRRADIDAAQIPGYDTSVMTHSEVARAVAEDRANVGVGIEAAARSEGLDFLFLTRERYDLAIPEVVWAREPVAQLVTWLRSADARALLGAQPGYEVDQTGTVVWVG